MTRGAAVQLSIGAPFGLLVLSDGAPDEIPEYEPDAQVVLSTGRTLLVRVRPEVDGDVVLQVRVVAAAVEREDLVRVHDDVLHLPERRLRCHDLRDREVDLLEVPSTRMRCVVLVDELEHPTRLQVDLVDAGGGSVTHLPTT